MDLRRRTWTAALILALVISTLAALIAVAVASVGEVAPVAIVLPVIVVGFAASWVQTDRVHRRAPADAALRRAGSRPAPTA